MSDRELLELAAKAADLSLYAVWSDFGSFEGYRAGALDGDTWNPLTDDGDALRLAVKLRLSVDAWGSGAAAVVALANRATAAEPHYGDDPERATRRAIVRAAAEIGRSMP